MFKWTPLALVLGFIIDLFLGDPRWLYHPVRVIVRSEDDIRRISQELYNLIQTGSRAQGRFSTA